MQNLRDQLLKTGLISKGQKHQVEQEKRHERKQLKKDRRTRSRRSSSAGV